MVKFLAYHVWSTIFKDKQAAAVLLTHFPELPPQVQADVRTIISRDFATRHSLRFPRVERIRYDKSPFDVQTDQELWDLVNQNKGVVGGELLQVLELGIMLCLEGMLALLQACIYYTSCSHTLPATTLAG